MSKVKSEKSQYVGQAIQQYENYLKMAERFKYKESDNLIQVMLKAKQRSEIGMLTTYDEKAEKLLVDLKTCVKFRLPDNGAVMSGVTEGKTLPFIINNFLYEQHLPFEKISLEYNTSNTTSDGIKYRASIIYVEEVPREGKRALLRVNILKNLKNSYDEKYSWSFLKYALEVDFEKVNNDTAQYFDFVSVLKWDESDMTNPKETITNTQNEIEVLMQFMLALSCKNVEVNKGYEPNPKENKKRQEKGHVLQYRYNTIHINTAREVAKGVNQSGNGASGRTVSPHLRRGHIRRYENKNIWVESTVVKADKADSSMKAKNYVVK